MHGVAQLAQTFGRATQAVDEFRGDRSQNERLAVALDGQLGAYREFHLLADLGGDDDLAFGAQGGVFGHHRGMVGKCSIKSSKAYNCYYVLHENALSRLPYLT